MPTPYGEALEFTLGREGGWYDGSEARDPNPTMYGVTQKTYNAHRDAKGLPWRSVREIEQSEVQDIYRSYWVDARCDKLPRLTAITMFDMSINAGPGGAIKCLQRVVGVTDDGAWGPKTEAAVADYIRTIPEKRLAYQHCWERIRYYVDLAKSERLRPNLLSWVHRVVLFREKYLK
jgi:Putative secretion activating protein